MKLSNERVLGQLEAGATAAHVARVFGVKRKNYSTFIPKVRNLWDCCGPATL